MPSNTQNTSLPVSIPRFDEERYLETNPTAREAISSGLVENASEHHIRFGIDDNQSQIRREPASLQGSFDRFLVSESGFCLVQGWLADEGCDRTRFRLQGGNFNVEFPVDAIFRCARPDVEKTVKEGPYDFGLVAFGRSPSKSLLKQSLLFQGTSLAGTYRNKLTPDIVSDKRIMDLLLQMIATTQAHAGKEVALYPFLTGVAGSNLVELFQAHVAASISDYYVERFRPRPISHSLVTVLFCSSDPIKIQPLLFANANVQFGEWIYVCNSPEDAETVLRNARLLSDLYDLMITVIVLNHNAGFGAANNVAVKEAQSARIFLMNPDVYPLPGQGNALLQFLTDGELGSTLWGGLLFYDNHNLMHSGIYFEEDVFIRSNALNAIDTYIAAPPNCSLLRTEHFDKGVPFDPLSWENPKKVPAVTGAVMAFDKSLFQKLGGFSTSYIYGHYEDADLSLRWSRDIGSVLVHPSIRLVHLEGQGSNPRGEEYRGAMIANRYFFSSRYRDFFHENRNKLSRAFDAPMSQEVD